MLKSLQPRPRGYHVASNTTSLVNLYIILILPCTFFSLEAVNPGFSFSSQREAIRYDVETTRELFKQMEEHLSKLEFKVSKL